MDTPSSPMGKLFLANALVSHIPVSHSCVSPCLNFSQDNGQSRGWEFGQHVHIPWYKRGVPASYQLDLADHSGVIVGLTEQGTMGSLLRLAQLAISNKWNVALLDAHLSFDLLNSFTTSMRRAQGDESHWFLEHIPSVRLWHWKQHPETMQTAQEEDSPLSCLPYGLHRQLHERLFDEGGVAIGDSPLHAIAPSDTCALYIGFNAGVHPEVSRSLAHLLVHVLTQESLVSQRPTLLLLRHPELLFDSQEIPQLFSRMEQGQGSVFLAARSLADFGSQAKHVAHNARTFIVHRSNTSSPFTPFVFPSWRNLLLSHTLRHLRPEESVVISRGASVYVRVRQTTSWSSRRVCIHPLQRRTEKAEASAPSNEEVDALLASIYGPDDGDDENTCPE